MNPSAIDEIKKSIHPNQPLIPPGFYSGHFRLYRVWKGSTGGNTLTIRVDTLREYMELPKSKDEIDL